jgi:hypothetical protein
VRNDIAIRTRVIGKGDADIVRIPIGLPLRPHPVIPAKAGIPSTGSRSSAFAEDDGESWVNPPAPDRL